MKTRITLFAFLLLSLTQLNAQTGFFGGTMVPLKPESPLFGKDIVINNIPTEDQGNVAICSAFNGWLFALATSYDSINHNPILDVLRSVDSGITWNYLFGGGLGFEYCKFKSPGIIAVGDSLPNLKIFISLLYSVHPLDVGSAFIWRLNGQTGDYETELFDQFGLNSIDIATDFNYPADFSSPSSLGILYSKRVNNIDSIIFRSSSNGGISLDNKKTLATSSNSIFRKVALNYGRSLSYPSGRYFAAWEAIASQFSNLGHIYTAHSNPNFNSPFTTPVQLDALDTSTLNMCRNPTIACQYSNVDNDSANLTEVVLFEKYKSSGGDYDVTGFYNLQATTTSHFRPLSIASTSNNELQPDISFNPYNSKFMVTYFDSTTKKLPFLTNDVNLANPDSWNVVNQGYNDNSNLVAPYPKVKVNDGQQEGMNAWISEGTGGNGVALFDAPYSTYTGISGQSAGTSSKLIGSYPNPCNKIINIAFEMKYAGRVTIDMMSIMGQPLGTITDQAYSAGKNTVQYDVSGLLPGNYLYSIRSGEFSATGKITVIR